MLGLERDDWRRRNRGRHNRRRHIPEGAEGLHRLFAERGIKRPARPNNEADVLADAKDGGQGHAEQREPIHHFRGHPRAWV